MHLHMNSLYGSNCTYFWFTSVQLIGEGLIVTFIERKLLCFVKISEVASMMGKCK